MERKLTQIIKSDVMKKITVYVIIGFLSVMLAACSNSDKWSPGPSVSEDNPGVYFSNDNMKTASIEAVGGNLTQGYFDVKLGRDASDLTSDLEVPMKVNYADKKIFWMPDTVYFEPGAEFAELRIEVLDFEINVEYKYSIEIEGKYGDTYKSLGDGEVGGSTVFEGSLVVYTLD